MTTGAAWQQEAWRAGERGGREGRAQAQDALYQAAHLAVGGDQALGVEFTEGNVECPLVGSQLSQAVQRQIDAFADADSGSPDEQEGIGVEIVGAAQLLLQELIILRGKRSGQIARSWREVFATNELGWKGMAVGGQIVQQAADLEEVTVARSTAERRLLFTEGAEPGEQMRIATQLGEAAKVGEGAAEISQEAVRGRSIVAYGARAEGEGEGADLGLEDLFQAGHER